MMVWDNSISELYLALLDSIGQMLTHLIPLVSELRREKNHGDLSGVLG